MDLVLKKLDSRERVLVRGLSMDLRNTIVSVLKLDQWTRTAVSILVCCFDVIACVDDALVILCQWVRIRFTKACSDALYGMENSFKNESEWGGCFVIDKFLYFGGFLLGIRDRIGDRYFCNTEGYRE